MLTCRFRVSASYVIEQRGKKKTTAVSLGQTLNDAEDGCNLRVADETASVLLELERKELRARLEKAMDRLPVHLKELFVWRHISGLSYEEMAEIKNLPVGTVKNRVFQAKEMMRGLLEETS